MNYRETDRAISLPKGALIIKRSGNRPVQIYQQVASGFHSKVPGHEKVQQIRGLFDDHDRINRATTAA